MREIFLAGGCFWGLEEYFSRINGIMDTECGYSNSIIENPSYEEVCTGKTKAAETVKIIFDENIISLEEILSKFFKVIDPTLLNRQGNYIGTQYRTGVYYIDPLDKAIITDYFIKAQDDYNSKIMIEILPLKNFYEAEEYHQDYLKKNPNGYCHIKLEI